MKELKSQTEIVEFVINEELTTIAEKILSKNPKIIGLGAYIWNATDIQNLIKILKKISPETVIVLGGPEASHEPYRVDFSGANYIIQGEGEVSFYELCRDLLVGAKPPEKIIKAKLPDTKSIVLPYDEYTDDDIKHRYTYIESSRGCPFECEFCLSSIDEKVRYFDLSETLSALQNLYGRGARRFKFIDRTFNLNMKVSEAILDFFLSHDDEYFVHFEVIPENFPPKLKEKLKLFRPGALQLEIGIQTLNPAIASNINRKIDIPKIIENIDFLQQHTHAHLHFDLIVGLPDESLESFGEGLNLLAKTTNSEIQIGILKKLSGTTLNRHDEMYGMVYSDNPPYEILQNFSLSFEQMQTMKRFARFWDITYNSGNFNESVRMIFDDKGCFEGFLEFTRWIYGETHSTWQISLDRMTRLIFEFLTTIKSKEPKTVATTLINDITKHEGRRTPAFLKDVLRS